MERRDFLKAAMAGGTLAATSLSAVAGQLPEADKAPILLVCQSDLPGASDLAAAIGAELHDSNFIQTRRVDRRGGALRIFSQIDAVLAQARPGRIVGVMDDASAVVFQAVAAAQGAAFLLQARHRFVAGGVCHQCQPTGLPSAIAWHESLDRWPAQVARLYADILAGNTVRSVRAEPALTADATAHAGLVSFVIAT
jgi:hypothetical protein